MTQTQQAPAFDVGTEVTITVTGRVVHSNPSGGAIVVEYLGGNGFADRTSFDITSPNVFVAAAPAPSADELFARERAARMVATASCDPEVGPRAHREWVARFNDAYPVGTWVRDRLDGVAVNGKTTGPARMYADRIAVVDVEGHKEPVVLGAVEPITETA